MNAKSPVLYVHVTVRIVRAPRPLHHPLLAPIIWQALREAFPDALAASLMPDHLHNLAPGPDEDTVRRKLAYVLRGLRRRKDEVGQIEWARPSAKGIFRPGQKVSRQCRYITLNPERKGLSDDPLRWPWTTHRDVMGAVVDPWVTPERLARACRRPVGGFRESYHEYVCGDPSVTPQAKRLPEPVAPGGHAQWPLAELRDAALSCTRSTPDALTRRTPGRRVFLELSYDQGWDDSRALAAFCDITPRAARNARGQAHTELLEPARLCLGDARLREGLIWTPLQPRAAVW